MEWKDTPHAIVWARAADPFDVAVKMGGGGTAALYGPVGRILDRYALVLAATGEDGRRPNGESPFEDLGPMDFAAIVFFDVIDGESGVVDEYCRQLRPAQLWQAATACEARARFDLNKDWVKKEIENAEQEQDAEPDVFGKNGKPPKIHLIRS